MKQFLAGFYERDLHKLIDEINLFNNTEDLWKTFGSIKNNSGNLILHLTGGLNYLVGANLGSTGYVRNRDEEFSQKGIEKEVLVNQVKELIQTISNTFGALSEQQLQADYPVPFDGATRPVIYVLVQLHSHLNYHLGQINYLRRSLQ